MDSDQALPTKGEESQGTPARGEVGASPGSISASRNSTWEDALLECRVCEWRTLTKDRNLTVLLLEDPASGVPPNARLQSSVEPITGGERGPGKETAEAPLRQLLWPVFRPELAEDDEGVFPSLPTGEAIFFSPAGISVKIDFAPTSSTKGFW